MAEGAKQAEAVPRFNDAALDQILNTVGERYWPPTLNREALRAALESASRILSHLGFLVDRRPPPRKMHKRVVDIRNTAKELETSKNLVILVGS